MSCCCFGNRIIRIIYLLGAFFLLSSYGANLRSAADTSSSEASIGKRLIIGVVTQPIPKSENPSLPIGFIDATYVDLLARFNVTAIPIYHDLSHTSLNVLLDRIDGVLITGGPTSLLKFNHSEDDEYSDDSDNAGAAKHQREIIGLSKFGRFIQRLAYQVANINKVNGTFPIYGICLGNEALGLAFAKDLDILQRNTRWKKEDQLAPIRFVAAQEKSKIMSGLPIELRNKMEGSDAHLFRHHWSLSYSAALNDSSFMKEFEIVATARDIHNTEYVAIIESKTNPFFGTQFHTNRIKDGKNTEDLQKEIQAYFFEYLINLANNRERPHSQDKRLIETFGITSDQKTKINTYHEGDVYVIDFANYPAKKIIEGNN